MQAKKVTAYLFQKCPLPAELIFPFSYVYLLYYMGIVFYFILFYFFTLEDGLLARSQYSEGPVTGHLDTGFSWFPCA